MATAAHPLAPLSITETNIARDVVRSCHPDTVIDFRTISLQEPPKAELVKFLDVEHARRLTSSTPRPARQARVHYDVIDKSKAPKYMESIVDVTKRQRTSYELISTDVHACLTV